MRKIGSGIAIAVATVGLFSVSGCNTVDPCTQLSAPTVAETQAAQSGAGVERELDDFNETECELVNGVWISDMSE